MITRVALLIYSDGPREERGLVPLDMSDQLPDKIEVMCCPFIRAHWVKERDAPTYNAFATVYLKDEDELRRRGRST